MTTTTRFALAATLAAGSAAHAGLVTFDPADGYALGTSLVSNPNWARQRQPVFDHQPRRRKWCRTVGGR